MSEVPLVSNVFEVPFVPQVSELPLVVSEVPFLVASGV